MDPTDAIKQSIIEVITFIDNFTHRKETSAQYFENIELAEDWLSNNGYMKKNTWYSQSTYQKSEMEFAETKTVTYWKNK